MVEIKGLGSLVQDMKRTIAAAREESSGMRDDTRAFIATVQEVRKQINQHHEDLRFEAETLGNSPPEDLEVKSDPGGSKSAN